MRKFDTSEITSTIAAPIKSGTIDHIQLAYQEALTALANAVIRRVNDTTNVYILYGCVNTGSGLNYIISAGALYYAGEVYLVDATTFTAAGGQTAVGNIVITQNTTNADPVTFSDSIARNVHNIRKIVFASAVSGSGLSDFANLIPSPLVLQSIPIATMPASVTVNFKGDQAIFYTSATSSVTINFDFTNAVPGSVVRLKWTFGAGLTLTINTPGGATIIRDSGNLAAVASANNLLYFIYLGVNDAGNNEVSYTLKQF